MFSIRSGAGQSIPLFANWHQDPEHITLDNTHVHVWKFPLDLDDRTVTRLDGILNRDEQRRARRFRFARHRVRFTVARGRLRMLLGRYMNLAPEAVVFGYSRRGKPELLGNQSWRLTFNISHSRDIALAAFALQRDVGIDVERIRSDTQFGKIAKRYFTHAEAAALQEFTESQKPTAFFRCWTLKEAYLKARGGGLAMGLDSVEVIVRPDARARITRIREEVPQPGNWRFAELLPGKGYVAALAVAGGDVKVHCYHWPPSQADGLPHIAVLPDPSG